MDKQVSFTEMSKSTPEDYEIVMEHARDFVSKLPDRILAHLELLKGDSGGMAIDRYEHCLQCATRAFRDGRDEEYVVCALLHDIGDSIASTNHADLAATMLEPFVSEKNHWIVKNHGIFQGYYFFDPAYDNMAIEHFEPMVRRVFAKPRKSIYKKESK